MTKKSISAHQLGVISGILLLTLKMTSLPSLMYEYGQTGGILNVIAFIGFDFLFLYLIILVKRIFPKTTLYEILKKYLGVFITKLLYVIFFLFFIFKILSIMSDSFTFIKDVVDEDFSIVKVFICFLPVISYLAFTGIRNIARTSEFFFPAIIVCLVVISVFAFHVLLLKRRNFASKLCIGIRNLSALFEAFACLLAANSFGFLSFHIVWLV